MGKVATPRLSAVSAADSTDEQFRLHVYTQGQAKVDRREWASGLPKQARWSSKGGCSELTMPNMLTGNEAPVYELLSDVNTEVNPDMDAPSKETTQHGQFGHEHCVEENTRFKDKDPLLELEVRLRELIRVKLVYFAPNRGVLRALLRNGADPKHPLSPFSPQTKEIRDIDIAWFRRILVDCGVRIPRDLEPHLPSVLWFFQMGVILFWVIDESPQQNRTERLLELASKSVATLIRFSALPLMRPLRKTALQLIEIAKGE